jgi:sodium pump decarboxylase gamma subunit
MELLQQALTIMTLGMALVFAFLAAVIAAVSLAARVIHRLEGAPVEEGSQGTASPNAPLPDALRARAEDEPRRLAAAAAAAFHARRSAAPKG